MNPRLKLLESYSSEFQAQLRRINAFVKHPTSIGTSHEGILRRFLQKYIPKQLAVGEGFIVDQQNHPSNQCDIIIWSHLDYAPYYREDDFVILPAEAVKAVIEVKTTLDKDEIEAAFRNLASIRHISPEIYTAIFAFESPKLSTVLQHLIGLNPALAHAVNSIYTMNGWVLQRAKDKRIEGGLLMETRPKYLKGYEELIPFSVIVPPADMPVAYGLTHFLAFLFIALEFTGAKIPFPNFPGSWIKGHIFPSHGVKVFSDSFSDTVGGHGFLNESQTWEFLSDVEEYMNQVMPKDAG
jgi:hypothetical protein